MSENVIDIHSLEGIGRADLAQNRNCSLYAFNMFVTYCTRGRDVLCCGCGVSDGVWVVGGGVVVPAAREGGRGGGY